MMRFPLSIVAALVVAAPAFADYEAGVAAYRDGDYETAFAEWLADAEAGDPQAQYLIGAMYRAGEGTEQSDEAAADWYRRASEQGYARAQFNLGVMYQKGEGVPRDDSIAAVLYRQAALQDFRQAQFNLAVLYQLGLGVAIDIVEAAAWYLIAASGGDDNALQRFRMVTANMSDEVREMVLERADAIAAEAAAAANAEAGVQELN